MAGLFLLFFSLFLPKHLLLFALITITEECGRPVLNPVHSDLYGWDWVKKLCPPYPWGKYVGLRSSMRMSPSSGEIN